MARIAKSKKRRKPVQNIFRFQVYEKDVQMLDYLSSKKNVNKSNVIRLALAEMAEREGLSLVGQDSGQFKDTLHNSQAEESRA